MYLTLGESGGSEVSFQVSFQEKVLSFATGESVASVNLYHGEARTTGIHLTHRLTQT